MGSAAADLARLFEASPEHHALVAAGVEPGWSELLLELAETYCSADCGADIEAFGRDALEDVLYSVVPRKVACDVEDAGAIVAEARALVRWLEREKGFRRAQECLAALEGGEDRLRRELEDRSNWGPAKSFVMEGREEGYDVATDEGLEKWAEALDSRHESARLAAQLRPPGGL